MTASESFFLLAAAVDEQEEGLGRSLRHRARSAAEEAAGGRQAEATKPHRHRAAGRAPAITHKFDIAGHEGYITVGLYPDGQPGEIFLKMAKEGSTVSWPDGHASRRRSAWRSSTACRCEDLVNKFAHVRFEPSGFTGNQEIPIAKSIVDYIFRWLGSRFLSPDDKAIAGAHRPVGIVVDEPRVSAAGSRSRRRFGGRELAALRTRLPRRRLLRPSPRAAAGAQPDEDQPKATAVATESVAAVPEELKVIANGNGHAATAMPTATGRPRTGTARRPRRSP